MLQAISVLTLASFSEWVLVLILSYEKSFSFSPKIMPQYKKDSQGNSEMGYF